MNTSKDDDMIWAQGLQGQSLENASLHIRREVQVVRQAIEDHEAEVTQERIRNDQLFDKIWTSVEAQEAKVPVSNSRVGKRKVWVVLSVITTLMATFGVLQLRWASDAMRTASDAKSVRREVNDPAAHVSHLIEQCQQAGLACSSRKETEAHVLVIQYPSSHNVAADTFFQTLDIDPSSSPSDWPRELRFVKAEKAKDSESTENQPSRGSE